MRLLQAGKTGTAGTAPPQPALQAFFRVVHRLDRAPSLRDRWVIGDLPVGRGSSPSTGLRTRSACSSSPSRPRSRC